MEVFLKYVKFKNKKKVEKTINPYGVLKKIRIQEMGNGSYPLSIELAGEEIFTIHIIYLNI